MPLTDSLAFRLELPSEDVSIEQGNIHSVSVRIEGMLHVTNGRVIMEWMGTKAIHDVSSSASRPSVSVTTEPVPREQYEFPAAAVIAATVRGRWWRPRLELSIASLEARGRVPGVRDGMLTLRIRRRDMARARAIASLLDLHLALREAAQSPLLTRDRRDGGP